MKICFSLVCMRNRCCMGGRPEATKCTIKFIPFFVCENGNIAKGILIGAVAIFKCYIAVVSH